MMIDGRPNRPKPIFTKRTQKKPRLFRLLFCKELSGLGLRHVGYGVPTELFSPYVTSAVEAAEPGDWLGQQLLLGLVQLL